MKISFHRNGESTKNGTVKPRVIAQVEPQVEPPKRGRGRPRGSISKKTYEAQERVQVNKLLEKKWDDEFYLQSYLLASQGLSDAAIRAMLKISMLCWKYFTSSKPALCTALNKGRSTPTKEVMNDYVYKRLSPDTEKIWKKVRRLRKGKRRSDKLRLIAFVSQMGKLTKQHLFLHACIRTDFNLTRASQMTNISYTEIRKWIDHDPDFTKLMDEIQWHQRNVIESHLMALVKAGDSHATLYADKKYSGYKEKSKVEVSIGGVVRHEHLITLNEIIDDLPLETQEQISQAINKRKEMLALENKVLDETTGEVSELPAKDAIINGMVKAIRKKED